ncbi:EpsG family protein [Flavobacterium ammonificans]|uniref:EpsG family protein n=1 Tax=Flavobacterium ammonificans TaxID=1751056 RepID=UPI00210576A7|nr:EpsG family protein [Flavobacterium ammonificans]
MNLYFLFFFIIFCFFLCLIERKTYIPHIKWLIIIPFSLIVANRSTKVPDTEAYLEFFNATDPSTFDDFDKFSFEIGFQAFTKIIKFIIDDNFILYFMIIVLINLIIVNFSINRIGKLFKADIENNSNFIFVGENRFLKNSNFSVLPLTLYIAFFGIYTNAIVLRAGFAVSIIIFTSTFALKSFKSFIDYIAICLLFVIGYFFHVTILIGILVILIMSSNKKFTKKTYLYTWFFIGVVYFTNLASNLGDTTFSLINTINNLTNTVSKISSYEGNVVNEGNGIAAKFIFFWIMAFVLILHSLQSKIYYKLLNVYLVGLLLFALFRSVILIERVTDFFLFFSFVIFYFYLITLRTYKFWLFLFPIIFIQLFFILRITN